MWPEVTARHCPGISPQTPVAASWGAPAPKERASPCCIIQECSTKPVCHCFTLGSVHQRALEKQEALMKSRTPMHKNEKIIVLARWDFIIRPTQEHAPGREIIIIWVIQPLTLLSTHTTPTNVGLEPLHYSCRNTVRESTHSKEIPLSARLI